MTLQLHPALFLLLLKRETPVLILDVLAVLLPQLMLELVPEWQQRGERTPFVAASTVSIVKAPSYTFSTVT